MIRPKKYGRKPIIRSTVLRIIVVVVLLVLPINIMTLTLTDRVVRNNRREILNETKNVLDMRGKSFEDMLNRAVKRLIFLSINEPEYMVLSSARDDGQQNDGQLLTVVRLSLDKIRIEYPWVNVLYFRFPNRGYTIMSGYMPGDPRFYRQTLDGLAIDSDDRGGLESIIMSETGVIIIKSYWNQMVFGTIVSLDRVLIDLGYTNNDGGKIHFFVAQDGSVLTKEGQSYLAKKGLTLEQLRSSGQYEIFEYKMDRFGISMVEVNHLSSIFDQMTVLTSGILLTIAILTVVLVIPLLLFSINKQISQPLHRLVKGIKRIEQGDMDYRIETGRAGSEFEEINQNFNQMMDQIKKLKIDVYEKELERKRIALRYLNQQVQPHFILNAMNLIYNYEPEEYPLIQKMVHCLSKYFRYIVNNNLTFVTLRQEADHIENYFEIQKARFVGLFESHIEYDPGLENALIPPLLIQNFAENAIKYALRIGRVVQIEITGKYVRTDGQPDRLLITISDNGAGITDDVLAKIDAFQKTGQPQKGLGVGMQNTLQRMKYLYDNKMFLKIQRGEHNQGTYIEITLPIHLTDEETGHANSLDR